jgi:hypothetical protein
MALNVEDDATEMGAVYLVELLDGTLPSNV